jgi:hypothetical protein
LAKLPGVELESEEADFQVVLDEPEPAFAELAAGALDNAGIDPNNRLQCAQDVVVNAALGADAQLLAVVEANDKEVVYEITFDLPDAGLGDHMIPPDPPVPADAPADVDIHGAMAAVIVADMILKPRVDNILHGLAGVQSAINHMKHLLPG